jgi:hypothetical protein
VLPEPSALFCRPPQVLAEQAQDAPVTDVERQPLHQQQMVDGGIERLDIGAHHEIVGGEIILHLPHSRFRATMAFDVSTARRHRQDIRQHDGERLQHQRITGRPKIDSVVIGRGDALEKTETKAARAQLGAEAGLLLLPVTPQDPNVGMVGVLPSPPTEPLIRGIEHGIGSELRDQHEMPLGHA